MGWKNKKKVLGCTHTLSLNLTLESCFLLSSASWIAITRHSSPSIPSIRGLPGTPIGLPSSLAFFALKMVATAAPVALAARGKLHLSSSMSLMAFSTFESPRYSDVRVSLTNESIFLLVYPFRVLSPFRVAHRGSSNATQRNTNSKDISIFHYKLL